jgi:hypothetical protein
MNRQPPRRLSRYGALLAACALTLAAAPVLADSKWYTSKGHDGHRGHNDRHGHEDRHGHDNRHEHNDRYAQHERDVRVIYRQPYAAHRPAGYRYVYYPRYETYYAPDRNLWYWPQGHSWHSASRAPSFLGSRIDVGGVTILLDSGRPYERHERIRREYAYGY